MSKTLYLDCFSGCSGDMLLATLIDLGYDPALLKKALAKLKLKQLTFDCRTVKRNGLSGTQIIPNFPDHEHHRRYTTIKSIIEKSTLAGHIKKNAIGCIKALGNAEAAIHGTTLNQVHFHEVGALDTIFDIVGFCAAVDHLGIKNILVSPINTGSGTVKCAHGLLPVPAPATVALLKGYAVFSKGPKTELTTPTAAAIIRTFAKSKATMPPGRLINTGYGAGAKSFKPLPNLLRGILIDAEQVSTVETDKVIVLKTNIDDDTPEIIAVVKEKLLKNGALDVAIVPVGMKKDRLGMQLEMLCQWDKVQALSEIILKETASIGLRIEEVQRLKLKRLMKKVHLNGTAVRIKYVYWKNKLIKAKPDMDDVKRVSDKTGMTIKAVLQKINQVK